MNIIRLIPIIVGLALALGSNAQQMSSDTMLERDTYYKQALRESMGTLRSIVNDENAQAMGFRSSQEAATATPGVPIPVLMIQLDELRKYQRGGNVRALFKNHQQYLVPVTVGNEVRSSITLQRQGERINAISYGSSNLVRSLDDTRQKVAKELNVAEPQFYAVHVAALRKYFIAYDDSAGQLMLVPVMDDAELNQKAGRALAAEEALISLQAVALRYNDLPI